MSFLKSHYRLVLLVIGLLLLAACNDNGSDGASNSISSVTELPSAVLTLPPGGQLRAYITIDGGARTEMNISANIATVSIPNLSRAPHSVLIEYEFTDSSGSTVIVATASQTVDLSSGDVSISFAETDYDLDSYDDDGDGISNAEELALGTDPTIAINIEGVWTITETSKPSNCELSAPLEIFDLTISQDGSSVTITDIDSNIFSGTLSDFNLSWSGSYPQDAPDGTAGLAAINALAIIDASCNSLTGNYSWTWTATDGSGYTCNGTTTFAGVRDPAIGCGTTTTDSPTGLWQGSFIQNGGGSMGVVVVVQGDQIRVIDELGTVALIGTLSVSGTSFTASTTDYSVFGPPTGTTTSLTGTFTAGSMMSGTFTSTDATSGTFSLVYDPDTDKGSSLAVTAGTWVGGVLTTLSIDSAGVFAASAIGGCTFSGTVSIIDATVNIYGMSVNSSTCAGIDSTSSGYAATTDTSSLNDTLSLVIHNSSYMFIDGLFKSTAAAN